jgi:predicted DNA-binding transcriptional regulator YafY
VEKLRSLDYPVEAAKGVDGGYRLGAGAHLPPLLLDDEDAVAIAIALRTATAGSVSGHGETALRALVKLEQVLPNRLRRRVEAMQIATVSTPGVAPTVDAAVLTAVAGACRDRQRLRFDYTGRDGAGTRREVEPHQVVTWGRRWYLVAWDVERADWRTFRVERIRPVTPTGPRFAPRPLPGGDAAAFLAGRIADRWPYQATVRLHAGVDSDAARGTAAYGRLEPLDEHSCLLRIGADDPHSLAFLLGSLTVDFDVPDAPELVRELLLTAARFRAAAGLPPAD